MYLGNFIGKSYKSHRILLYLFTVRLWKMEMDESGNAMQPIVELLTEKLLFRTFSKHFGAIFLL